MPYYIKHEIGGYFLINKDTGRHYSLMPMTLEKAKRQIAVLEAAEKKEDPPMKQVKFIQEVVSSPSFKAGAFTKQAKAHDMTVKEFKEEVISHPEKYDLTTRRRAMFLKNIERK
jgi:hypothetical protein